MEKVEVDGKIAVLYSSDFGAGWSSWYHSDNKAELEFLTMSAELVKLVQAGDKEGAAELAEERIPDFYSGGSDDLKIGWVPKGAQFEITEYDGKERLHIIGESQYLTA